METAINEALTLVRIIVLSLVDHPKDVEITAQRNELQTMICIKTNPLDTGKIVGKMGRTARSIRTILAGHSMRVKHRFALDIEESGQRPPRIDRETNEWRN